MSNVLRCRVVATHRNKEGKISGYTVQEETGKRREITRREALSRITTMEGLYYIENLKLTSNNKLIISNRLPKYIESEPNKTFLSGLFKGWQFNYNEEAQKLIAENHFIPIHYVFNCVVISREIYISKPGMQSEFIFTKDIEGLYTFVQFLYSISNKKSKIFKNKYL